MGGGVCKMALPSLSSLAGSAAPLHLFNTRELCVIAVVVSSARVAREVAVQENLEIVGLVVFFVFFFIIYL